MRRDQQSVEFLSDNPCQRKFKQPPKLSEPSRPYKGIFLTYFLLCAGLLFFFHGLHKFQQYTVLDLVAVWVLSFLLIMPGGYFAVIIFAIQAKVSGFNYNDHRELFA